MIELSLVEGVTLTAAVCGAQSREGLASTTDTGFYGYGTTYASALDAIDHLLKLGLLHEVTHDEAASYADLYPAEGGSQPLVEAAPPGSLIVLPTGAEAFERFCSNAFEGTSPEDYYHAYQRLAGGRLAIYASSLRECWELVDLSLVADSAEIELEPTPIGPWPFRHRWTIDSGYRAVMAPRPEQS